MTTQQKQLEAKVLKIVQANFKGELFYGSTNEATQAITALIQEAVNEGRVAELESLVKNYAVNSFDKNGWPPNGKCVPTRYIDERIKELQ